jgi:hypothetical protein
MTDPKYPSCHRREEAQQGEKFDNREIYQLARLEDLR